ncbi:class A beta-lactamase, subclass A2 [Frigoriflavimonas asaccharolytica]|uniref:beta-lactamase n=1 Tax=Frigoriflavimonas asaccharolytica TaxID=2735899 RepID=A0A8J8G545_9FLAO|nr:class A beta-lactamase, subclass A2 [Frigoriflavimonas asaccharolytica]NRS91633.1 beta-lactamase class A [Frigoriflavimonas asaccharolytica]
MKKTLLILLSIFLFSCTEKKNNQNPELDLQTEINKIIAGKNATIAVSVNSIEDDFKIDINGNKELPLLSVFKFHVAIAILNEVDAKKLNLNQKIAVEKSDLHDNTYSPFRDEFPNGSREKTLGEVLKYVVSQSDNNITDVLIKKIGGTKIVQQTLDNKGIKNFKISANEAKMHENWKNMYLNTSSTNSLNDALKKLYDGDLLSKNSTDFLMKTMLETTTGANKIVAQLPKNTPVAHKTGASGKNDAGLTAAENDIAIITLPNGKHYAISILISDSMESEETNTKLIADISKTVYDYLIKIERK